MLAPVGDKRKYIAFADAEFLRELDRHRHGARRYEELAEQGLSVRPGLRLGARE